MKRAGVILIVILAFLGLADSLYLTQSELSGTPLLCNIQNLSGCNVVATSQYSHIFGIPLAEFGILFYGIMFVLAALEIVIFDQFLRRLLQAIALLGLVSSLYFVFVQIFFIGAFCIYCTISGFITLGIFICASRIEPLRRHPPLSTAKPLPMPPKP
ncbi:MAG: vitamin K epoxide reductase family protein [Candidatus Pacebacteria bacterium]|nr:vitamin K epoxide reductase family protein [Candidatus Paceibacterota bacterium]